MERIEKGNVKTEKAENTRMDGSFFTWICVRKFSFVLSKSKYFKLVNVGNGISYNLFIKELLTSIIVLYQGKNDFQTLTGALKAIFTV
jgi:hypothetical protein